MSSIKANKVISSAATLKKKASRSSSVLSRQEEKQLELDSRQVALRKGHLQNYELSEIINLRKSYSNKILWFTGIWSFVTLLLIILDSWSIWGCNISTNVLATLVGTTFGNVIALATVVAKGIFTRKE